jgi:uncharacterized membrane protein YdfJ with MMPL/SSD domain
MDWRRIALWLVFVAVVAAAVVLIGRVAVLTFKSQREQRAEYVPQAPALHSAVLRCSAAT